MTGQFDRRITRGMVDVCDPAWHNVPRSARHLVLDSLIPSIQHGESVAIARHHSAVQLWMRDAPPDHRIYLTNNIVSYCSGR
jgi:hypothetical protein